MRSDFADFLPHGVAHSDDHGIASLPSSTMSARAAALAWWVVGRVPWYLWVMAGLYVWGRHVKGNGGAARKRERRTRRPAPTENAPRRPEPPSRDVVYRSASPLAMPRPSSPNLERRGSYRRYSSGAQQMEERPRSSSGLRNVYTPTRSLSSPRPLPSIDPLQQAEPHSYSTSALPRPSTGAGPSTLRNAYPSSSAPAVPTVRKRAHDEDDGGATGKAEKRSRVDEAGAYDFAHMDDEAMELDDDAADEEAAVAAPPKRGTKRRDEGSDDEGDAKRTRTKEPETGAAMRAGDQSGKKRRASSSGSSAGSTSPAAGPSKAQQQQKKKARKGALGTGSVRDKRAVDDTSFDDEDALELSGDEGGFESRNADSDVDSAADEDTTAAAPRVDEGKTTPGQIKRFRSRRDRSGSDNDDLMGDVEPVYGSSTAASSASSPPASAHKSGSLRNARLGRLLAKQSRSSTPQRRGAPTKRETSPSPSAEDLELVSPDTPRKAGDEWTNHEGDRYRIDADGTQRRLCEVREKRLKFRMPKDSKHPDARATHVVIVEKWLTAEEYEQAFAHRKLAWQITFEEEARQQRMQEDEAAAPAPSTAAGPHSPAAAAERERAIYFTRGVGTPLRAYRNLDDILARPAAGGGSASGSAPASPRASPLLANGRVRLTGGGSGAGTPRSASRKWSEMEVKKLLEGEEAARTEREKRRLGYLALGGDLYETEQERGEREAREEKEKKVNEPAKIKLTDYALAAPSSSGTAQDGEKDDKKASAPAAPASSPTPAPATSTKASAPNFFAATTPASSAAPSEAAKPAAPAFSFGAPAPAPAVKKAEAAAPAASKALFGAPTAAATKDGATQPAFSFGASAAPEKNQDEAPKPAFSFGAAPAAAIEKKDEGPKPAPFSFGAPAAAAAEQKNEPAAAPHFGFGAPPAAEKKDDAATPAFSFGAPAAATEKQAEQPAASAAPFSFGAPAAPSASEAPKPAFGFGAQATSGAAPTSAQPSPFSFGGAPPAPKVAEETSKPPASPFSFGASAAPAAAQPAAPSPFSFGASNPTPAPSSGISFGQPATAPAVSPATSAPASGGFSFGQPSAPAPAGFSFGAPGATASPAASASTGFSFAAGPGPASPAAAAPGGGFTFGAAPSTGANASGSAPMFSFGSAGEESASGTTTPRRRPTRRLPTRQG